MKTIDERELEKATKEKQTKTERNKGNRSYSERVRAKWFCCTFKLGFLQLICKVSFICKAFNNIGFNVFYVIMKGFPVITNFKRPIYQTFN